MIRRTALALAALLILGGVPALAQEDPSIREQNRAWLLDENPGYDPGELVDVHSNGSVEQMPAEQALEIVLDRAGETSLEEPVAEAERPTLDHPLWQLWFVGTGAYDFVGDIWVIGTGNVDCGETTAFAPAGQSARLDPQLWLYPGHIGYNQGSAAEEWTAVAWTMMDAYWAGSGPINYGGASDFFCIEGDGFELLFPFIDGYTTAEDVPPAGGTGVAS